jgi:hypothetical protein
MKAIVHTLIVMKRYASVSRSLLLINRSLLLINRSLFTHVDRDEKVRSYAAPLPSTHTQTYTHRHITHTQHPTRTPKIKIKVNKIPAPQSTKAPNKDPQK